MLHCSQDLVQNFLRGKTMFDSARMKTSLDWFTGRIYSKPGFSLHPAMFLLNQSKTRLCRAIIGRLLPLVRGQLEMLPVDLA